MRTVAVFSDADARARHTREADEALWIGPAAARESYLDIERIIAAARASGADAIHPGYGFLSENAQFAQACGGRGTHLRRPAGGGDRRDGLEDRRQDPHARGRRAGAAGLCGAASRT